MASDTGREEQNGRFSGACYPVSMVANEGSPMCGPAFFCPEPIDPELFDDRGPGGQVLAAAMPLHDVYITPARRANENDQDGAVRPQPVHLLVWDLLAGVLFFASGKPPVSCR